MIVLALKLIGQLNLRSVLPPKKTELLDYVTAVVHWHSTKLQLNSMLISFFSGKAKIVARKVEEKAEQDVVYVRL